MKIISLILTSLLISEAAKEMFKFEQAQPYVTGLFLMDGQETDVTMTNKSADYWQASERLSAQLSMAL